MMVLIHLIGIFMSTLLSLTSSIDPWELPLLPSNPPSYLGNATKFEKLIPRHLWIAVRDASDVINAQMPALFERNPKWEVHIVDNHAKDVFMNTTFANTSLLWAYHILSPAVGAAKADIWRYAVLWTYGGAYIDDDSDMKDPLDKMIEPLDELIVAYEKNGFNADTCYIPRYHLSDFSTFAKNATAKKMNVFFGRVLLNWAIVSAPKHQIIAHTMKNVVDIIKSEFLSESVLRSLNFAYRWSAVMCATGPSLMTASAREIVLSNPPNLVYKLARTDFQDYGGKFKAISTRVRDNPQHYMNMHKNKDTNLLSYRLPEQPLTTAMLDAWQGEAVQGQVREFSAYFFFNLFSHTHTFLIIF